MSQWISLSVRQSAIHCITLPVVSIDKLLFFDSRSLVHYSHLRLYSSNPTPVFCSAPLCWSITGRHGNHHLSYTYGLPTIPLRGLSLADKWNERQSASRAGLQSRGGWVLGTADADALTSIWSGNARSIEWGDTVIYPSTYLSIHLWINWLSSSTNSVHILIALHRFVKMRCKGIGWLWEGLGLGLDRC